MYVFAWKSKIPWLALGLSGTLLTAATVMLAGPVWVYAGNADEFAASASQILSVYLPYLLAAFTGSLALLLLLPTVIARPFALILALAGTAAWAQATFLMHDFGPLDGQNWSIDFTFWRVILEVTVLLVAMMITGLLASKAPAMAAGLIALLAIISVAEPASRLQPKSDLRETVSASPLFQFSPEKNLLLVLLDGMQSEIFDEVTKENPEILTALDGFTYYPDTAGVGYSTVLTIPVIHSGQEYEPGKLLKPYFKETVTDGSFMNELASAGYSTALINPLYGVCPSGANLCTRAKTVLTTVHSTIAGEANKLLSMGIFRAAPLFLKESIYNGGKWLQLVSFEDPRTAHFSVEGNTFMEDVAAKASLTATQPTVKLLHLFSTHLPVAVNERCDYIGDQKSTRDGFKQQAKCALSAFAGLLNGLRVRGIYDHTAIILLSDHGSGGWPSARGIPSDIVASNLTAVANPTLAFKPLSSSGPMLRDSSPMSLADIPGLVCSLTSDCSMKHMADGRTVRRYRHYKWDGSAWAANVPIDITSYHITGPVYDGRTWTKASPEADTPVKSY